MRLPNGWGAAETGVTLTYMRMPKNLGGTPKMVQRLTRFCDIITTARQGQCNQYLRRLLYEDLQI
jgi:hypothetical protein